jgi:hypothetical protein
MNGIRFGDDGSIIQILPEFRVIGAESFHPTPKGHQYIAESIKAQIANTSSDACSTPCAVHTDAPSPSIYWNVTDHPIRSTQVAATADTVTHGTSAVRIKLSDSPFRPASKVAVSLHSESVSLGEVDVESNGTLSANITLPLVVTPGIHTLRLTGQSADGEQIDAYQEITFLPAVQTSVPLDGPKNSAIVSGGGVPGMTSSVSVTPPSTGIRAENDFIPRFITVVVVAIGIMGICLLLVRLSKK